MGTTTQLTTFADLYTDLMNRVRDETSKTATSNQAKRYINVALHDMHIGYAENYPWAIREATLLTKPKYTTGTVAVTQGSTTVTGTDTLWATANAWGENNVTDATDTVGTDRVTIGGRTEVFDVATIGSDTSMTLAQKWVGETDTGLSYVAFRDAYALATDFLRPLDQRRFSQGALDIPLIGRSEFRRQFPKNSIPSLPTIATLENYGPLSSTTMLQRIRFHPPPSEAMVIPYSYATSHLAVDSSGTQQTQLVSDTDEPIVPLRYRHAIVFHALYHWYLSRKDDARAAASKQDYIEVLGRITADNAIGQETTRWVPARASYLRGARRPYSGSGRYDLHGRFDRFEDR